MRLFKKKLPQVILKTCSPKTPGMRHYKYVTKYLLAKQNRVLKTLVYRITRAFGKSSTTGKTLVWGRSSGCKMLYRRVSFQTQDFIGLVLFSIYDPNRTVFISAVFDFLCYKFFFLPAVSMVVCGSIVGCNVKKKIKYFLGFRYTLSSFTKGLPLCLLSIKINKHAQYARGAGTSCQVLTKTSKFCVVRLPSRAFIKISAYCFATLGVLSNKFHRLTVVGKAGRNRLFGFKPRVRGVAMNPVDNPHGGRTNGGCCWVTPWGRPFLFKKTSRFRKYLNTK